jgi:hypothetical protein
LPGARGRMGEPEAGKGGERPDSEGEGAEPCSGVTAAAALLGVHEGGGAAARGEAVRGLSTCSGEIMLDMWRGLTR